jgi:TIR domain
LNRQRARDAAGRVARVSVFLSYAHRDERLRDELEKHLSPLRRSALIDTWDDRRITPGAELDAAIDQRLETADLVLLLISPDFINSDYCYRREMRAALRRHTKGQARVIPIILRPVDWLRTPIGRLLATPRDAKPVTTWHRRDDALLDVATSVRRAAEEITNQRTTAAGKPASPLRNRRSTKKSTALRNAASDRRTD